MIEKIRERLKRDLWSLDSKGMQKEIIDCHNIILALVDGISPVRDFIDTLKSDYPDLPLPAEIDTVIEALTTTDKRIGEILGREK